MLDGLQDIAAAWRTVAHVSEWSGLSIGALLLLALLVYLVPGALKWAIRLAIVVAVGFVGTIHGDRVGRADVTAQWADARQAAAAAQQKRDADIEHQLEAKYQPQLADLQKQSDERKARADTYESKIIALLAKSPAGNSCQLGDAARRVRGASR